MLMLRVTEEMALSRVEWNKMIHVVDPKILDCCIILRLYLDYFLSLSVCLVMLLLMDKSV